MAHIVRYIQVMYPKLGSLIRSQSFIPNNFRFVDAVKPYSKSVGFYLQVTATATPCNVDTRYSTT